MKMQSGSALLLVMVVTTALMVCVTNVWYTASLASDAALERQHAEQHLQATQGLLTYAVALCADNARVLCDPKRQSRDTTTFSLPQWPCGDGQAYTGHIISEAYKGTVTITAHLKHQDTPVTSLQCTLKVVNGRVVIDAWTPYVAA